MTSTEIPACSASFAASSATDTMPLQAISVTVLHPDGPNQAGHHDIRRFMDVPANVRAKLLADQDALVREAIGDSDPAQMHAELGDLLLAEGPENSGRALLARLHEQDCGLLGTGELLRHALCPPVGEPGAQGLRDFVGLALDEVDRIAADRAGAAEQLGVDGLAVRAVAEAEADRGHLGIGC